MHLCLHWQAKEWQIKTQSALCVCAFVMPAFIIFIRHFGIVVCSWTFWNLPATNETFTRAAHPFGWMAGRLTLFATCFFIWTWKITWKLKGTETENERRIHIFICISFFFFFFFHSRESESLCNKCVCLHKVPFFSTHNTFFVSVVEEWI